MKTTQPTLKVTAIYGFSLIELCLVIALVGIITSMAIPAYSHYSSTARQASAMSRINQIALALERHNHEHHSYETDFDTLEVPDSDQWFEYSIENADRFSYQIQAIPFSDNGVLTGLRMNHVGQRMHRPDGNQEWRHGWP